MTVPAVHQKHYTSYNTHQRSYNQSPNRPTIGLKSPQGHRRNNNNSPQYNNKSRKPPTAKKIARMALAEKESVSLKSFLQHRQWLPRPECDSEQVRKVAMKTLEMVLCQWASSLQSIRPTGQSKWQRPRGMITTSLLTFLNRRKLADVKPDSSNNILAPFSSHFLFCSDVGVLWKLPTGSSPTGCGSGCAGSMPRLVLAWGLLRLTPTVVEGRFRY